MSKATKSSKIKIRLVLLGEGRSGKSSITARWLEDRFDAASPSTTEAQMYTNKKLSVDGVVVDVSVTDTAGQERYNSLGPIYYRNADGAVLLYDCTDEDTLDRAKRWIKELQKAANPNIQLVLCGNKCDLVRERQVTPERGDAFARKYEAEHFSTSAKTGEGVDEAFMSVIRRIVAVKQGTLTGGVMDALNGDGGDDLFGDLGGGASSRKKTNRMKIVDDDEVQQPPQQADEPRENNDDDNDGSSRPKQKNSSSASSSSKAARAKRQDFDPNEWQAVGNYDKKTDEQDDGHNDDGEKSGTGSSSFSRRGGGGYDVDHSSSSAASKISSSSSTSRKAASAKALPAHGDADGGDNDYSVPEDGLGALTTATTTTQPKKQQPVEPNKKQQPQAAPASTANAVKANLYEEPPRPKNLINLAAPPPKKADGSPAEKKCAC